MPYSLIGKTVTSFTCKNRACGGMAKETLATPAMATLPIGDGRFNPYPFEDAGSSPATATIYKSVLFFCRNNNHRFPALRDGSQGFN